MTKSEPNINRINKMEIPSSFMLFGTTIRIKFPAEMFIERDGGVGFASYRTNEINLKPSSETYPLSKEQIEEAFFHEMVHFVLYHAGASYSGKTEFMHQDEGFVDIIANLLHQAFTTMVFGDND